MPTCQPQAKLFHRDSRIGRKIGECSVCPRILRTPEQERVAAFQRILKAADIPVFVRRPRGRDIFAACGQLKRTVEIAPASS